MVRALPDSLHELIGFGVVCVKCRKCGREARFGVSDLSRWLRLRGEKDDWQTVRRKFVCRGWEGEGCGSRNVELTFELKTPKPKREPPKPLGDCPEGIDLHEWARADSRERKRLLRRLRG